MKTLWKRLSKENRNKLKVSAIKYPHSIGPLIKALKTEYSYISLSFECIIFLLQETTGEQTTYTNVDKLFNDK